jgi:hypothetical protein
MPSITLTVPDGARVTVNDQPTGQFPGGAQTSLKMQVDFIKSIQGKSLPMQVRALRSWLGQTGYDPAFVKYFPDEEVGL